MQYRLQPRGKRSLMSKGFIIKFILIVLALFFSIFLLDKIDFSSPTKLIKQEISNDKLITIK